MSLGQMTNLIKSLRDYLIKALDLVYVFLVTCLTPRSNPLGARPRRRSALDPGTRN